MKNKIIKIITLAIFMIVSTVNINNVQAEPEENINNVEEKIQQITNENETEIQKMQTRESTDTPSSIAEGDESEDDEVEGDETEVELTDFSKAQFSLKKDGISDAIIEISGVTPKDESNYYLYITPTSDKPSINSDVSDERIALSYDEETKTLKTVDLVRVTDCVEKDQEIYVSIVEHVNLKDYIVLYGKKLNKYAESKYSDAFSATFMTNSADQIVTNFTHVSKNNRKLQIKVGKITDISILQKIKDKDSTGFSSLMNYAKSNTGIYNEKLNADNDDSYAIEYNAGSGETTGNKVIDLKGLEHGGYYYLYIKTDDENGKYVSNEAVTLAEANVYNTGDWFLFFYGSSDFKWADFGNINANGATNDDTTAKGKIPQTGIYNYAIVGLVVLGVIGIISYKKYKNNNF